MDEVTIEHRSADDVLYIEYPFAVVDAAAYHHFITEQDAPDFRVHRKMLSAGSVRYVESISGLNDIGFIEIRSVSATVTRLSYHTDTDLSEGFQKTLNAMFASRLRYLAFFIGAELIGKQYYVDQRIQTLQGHRPEVLETIVSQQREQERHVLESVPPTPGNRTDASPYYDRAFEHWQRSSRGQRETLYRE
jgi:hypothetical protein